ncbi:MAG: FAD-dependent oxidoreductase [Bacteroidales bacterium]
MKNRIGVYICHCGGNISDYVEVGQVREAIKDDPGVVLAKDMMFTCSDSTQSEMIEDIKENNLDAIVVASCSPKLHLYTFRDVARRAGLNPYNYVQVNLREHCSWAHSDKPKEATEKGVGLVRAGIARVRQSEALDKIRISALNAVLVVGAGISGMRAAIELADMGTDVYLVEKDFFVGGRPAQMQELFQTNEKGKEIVAKLYNEIKERPNIKLFTGAELESLTGNIGNFQGKVRVKPRYIKPDADKERIKEATEKLPEEVPDAFNLGLTRRKTIYKNYEGALPDIPVVDKAHLNSDNGLVEEFKDVVDLEQKEEVLDLKMGAVMLSTGFDHYEPAEGEYGYKKVDNVITLPQFKRIIELNGNNQLTYNGKEIRNIVYIYCVGNRQVEGENKYCSRHCCSSAIHTSVSTRDKFENIKGYHLYRDIRTYGKQELMYEDARTRGDLFLRFSPEEPPVVEEEQGEVLVRVKDQLSQGEEIEVKPDLVVLVTGMVPRNDAEKIGGIVKAPIGRDKFFNEVHPKLRPVETVIDGIFIAGSCQGPKNIMESMNSSLAASAKAYSLVSGGEIELEPIVATVNKDTCEWCGKCLEVCDYDAISKVEYDGKSVAEVNQALCKGGGMCLPVCPEDAIDLVGYTDDEIESMIDGLSQEVELESKAEKSEEERAETRMKDMPDIWHRIIKTLDGEQKTISQIAEELDVPKPVVTYNLMTLVKYGYIHPGGMDDMEEYYTYEVTQ